MPHVRSEEVVKNALADCRAGVPDVDVAATYGVAVKTVRRWRQLYEREGRPRGQSHTVAPCPRCHGTELAAAAYAELFGWYLGDGWLERHRRGVFALHIYNGASYTELNAGIQSLMRKVKPACRPHTRSTHGCVVTTVSWNHWPCLFPQHGPGRKHERRLTLEAWQSELLSEHPGPFLRGLFHSDGRRTNNWTTRMVGVSDGATTTAAGSSSTTRPTSSSSAPTRSTPSASRGGGRRGRRSRCRPGPGWPRWTGSSERSGEVRCRDGTPAPPR